MIDPSDDTKYWIFVTGPSGAGKTTVIGALEENHGYKALRVGPYFREKIKSDEHSDLKEALMLRIPVPNKYIEKYIHEHLNIKGQIFLIDGLPRSKENIDLIDRISPLNFVPIFVVINIGLKDSIKRILKRRICVGCGNVGNNPICLHCGHTTILRKDDEKMDVNVLSDRYDSMQLVISALSKKHKAHLVDGSEPSKQVIKHVYHIIQQNISGENKWQ